MDVYDQYDIYELFFPNDVNCRLKSVDDIHSLLYNKYYEIFKDDFDLRTFDFIMKKLYSYYFVTVGYGEYLKYSNDEYKLQLYMFVDSTGLDDTKIDCKVYETFTPTCWQ